METLIHYIEIFAFVTGIAYILLEIGQKKFMWVIGIATGIACAFSFAVQHLYASAGLNFYYVLVSFWGLYQWRKDEKKLDGNSSSDIHLNKLGTGTAVTSAIVFVLGSAALIALLRKIGGSETEMDAVTAVMSAIATWWLAKSYAQQWLIWIAADLFSTVLCFSAGMNWMGLLYIFYTGSAIYGYVHWKRKGETVG